jgi:hypothetical protein
VAVTRWLGLLPLWVSVLSAQQPAAVPTVTVAGVAFAQYSYSLLEDSSTAGNGHQNNFDVTRTFVHVLGHFSDGISTRVTVDVDGRKAASNQLSLRLAYAYVSWQPNARGPLTWKMGLMHTPWNEFEEAVWDYRMQGKSVLDRNGYGNTADFGAGVDGNWNDDRVNMQAGIYDGEGAYNAPGDAGKDVSARVSVRLAGTGLTGRVGGLRLSGYADIGTATGGAARRRLLGMLSYRSPTLTLAALVAATQDSTGPATPRQHGVVESVFGVLNLPHTKAALIGRIDSYDPDTDQASDVPNSAVNVTVNRQTRVILGASYSVSPHLRVLADADLVSVANGATNVFDRTRQLLYFHTEFKF